MMHAALVNEIMTIGYQFKPSPVLVHPDPLLNAIDVTRKKNEIEKKKKDEARYECYPLFCPPQVKGVHDRLSENTVESQGRKQQLGYLQDRHASPLEAQWDYSEETDFYVVNFTCHQGEILSVSISGNSGNFFQQVTE